MMHLKNKIFFKSKSSKNFEKKEEKKKKPDQLRWHVSLFVKVVPSNLFSNEVEMEKRKRGKKKKEIVHTIILKKRRRSNS